MLLNKILNYEQKVFYEYLANREIFRKRLHQINTNTLTNNQLLIFIHDIKAILDPIKTSTDSIYHFCQNETFDDTTHLELDTYIKKIFPYLFLLGGVGNTEQSESESESDSSDKSESDEYSDSDNSSKSVSLTCSR